MLGLIEYGGVGRETKDNELHERCNSYDVIRVDADGRPENPP